MDGLENPAHWPLPLHHHFDVSQSARDSSLKMVFLAWYKISDTVFTLLLWECFQGKGRLCFITANTKLCVKNTQWSVWQNQKTTLGWQSKCVQRLLVGQAASLRLSCSAQSLWNKDTGTSEEHGSSISSLEWEVSMLLNPATVRELRFGLKGLHSL